MTEIRVGIYGDVSKTITVNKPFEYITSDDIVKVIGDVRIIGWCKA